MHRFSGISWAFNQGDKEVHIVKDWPNPGSMVSQADKVPSKISYQNGRPQGWGYAIQRNEQSFSNFKSLLNAESGRITPASRRSADLLESLGKSPEEVVADYLRFIWQHARRNIEDYSSASYVSTCTFALVMTMPAT